MCREFCSLLESATQNGIALHIFGWEDPFLQEWRGSKRFQKAREVLEPMEDEVFPLICPTATPAREKEGPV